MSLPYSAGKRSLFGKVLVLLAALLSACAPAIPPAAPTRTPTDLPETAVTPSPTRFPTAPPADPVHQLWLSPDLPPGLVASLALPAEIILAPTQADADLTVEVGGTRTLSTWTYALAAPLPTIPDEVSSSALRILWSSGSHVGAEGKALLVDRSTASVFTALWGKPSRAVRVISSSRLLDEAWKLRTAWAILPFEDLEPRWKVLAVDGQSPVRKDFDPTAYPLLVNFSLSGDPEGVGEIHAAHGPRSAAPLLAPANRDPSLLTTVILTGVTALVRGTASLMEYEGMDYPAIEIAPILRQADILHINNEVPFAENCPAPYPWEGLVFCSQERYIELLDLIGTDVVELAGDHFADWGPEAMLNTLDLYRQRGWPVYGGGENIEAAKEAVFIEHNGNKIAFIGCNYKAKGYATASMTNPGAVHCDPSWLYPQIRAVKAKGYLPIVTFQHEEYYEYIARPKLKLDFRGAAAAGAVIVSGSQAHQPHAVDLNSDAFIHYGLGNLFFDQVGTDEATRWAFLDRHVFFNGRHISTELISIVFVDLARSRLATEEERREMLEKVFTAGGW